jgi:hypothetical protein
MRSSEKGSMALNSTAKFKCSGMVGLATFSASEADLKIG